MSLAVIEASAFNHKDPVDGVGVFLHVVCAGLTTSGTMILIKCFSFFIK